MEILNMANMDQPQSNYSGFGAHLKDVMKYRHIDTLKELHSLTDSIGYRRLVRLRNGAEPKSNEVRELARVFSYDTDQELKPSSTDPTKLTEDDFGAKSAEYILSWRPISEKFDPVLFYLKAGHLPEGFDPDSQEFQDVMTGYNQTQKPNSSFEDRIGHVLSGSGFISLQQLGNAYRMVGQDADLLDTLVSYGSISQETLITVLSYYLKIPVVDIRHLEIDPEAVKLLSEEDARKYNVLPTGFDTDGSLRVATKMPNNFQLSADLTTTTGRQAKFVLAIGGKLEDIIDKIYP